MFSDALMRWNRFNSFTCIDSYLGNTYENIFTPRFLSGNNFARNKANYGTLYFLEFYILSGPPREIKGPREKS